MTHIAKQIPETGFIRLPAIIGNQKSTPPIQPLIPISRTSWLNGVKDGIYPRPIKLGARSVAWKVEDIRALVERLGGGA
jgi:prophage regulatory protein